MTAVTCWYAANGKGARWRDKDGQPIDFLALLRAAKNGRVDQPISIERKGGPNLAMRLVAIRKPEKAAAESRRKAKKEPLRPRIGSFW